MSKSPFKATHALRIPCCKAAKEYKRLYIRVRFLVSASATEIERCPGSTGTPLGQVVELCAEERIQLL